MSLVVAVIFSLLVVLGVFTTVFFIGKFSHHEE